MLRANDGTRTGGEILIDQLVVHGVQHVFCVPGESYLAALDAFYDRPITLTVCRQEGGATMMAEAIGKATGQPGVVFVTRGPGATNASPGIHIAMQDSTPLIVFVGQVGREMRDREAFQELNYRAVFGTMAKWAVEIDDPARIPEIVSRAFYTACNGRPGPVVVALPEDMLVERVAVPDAPAFEPVEMWPGLADMAKLQKLLWAAKAPIVLLGGSRWSEAACAALQRFAGRFAVPVATTFRRGHLFDALHECYAGDLGIGPNPKLLARIKGSDLVLLIGGRMGEMPSQSYSLFDIPGVRQTFIHVHPGSEELGRVYHPHLAINAAPTGFCAALEGLQPPNDILWRAETKTAHADYLTWTEVATPQPGNVNFGEIMVWLRNNLPADAIITNGAGNFASWVHRFFRFRRFAQHIAPTSGSMGYGPPAAVGMKRLYPNRQVICLAGDGDFLMNGQDFMTAVQYDLPFICIIVDNGSYGTIRMHQEREYPNRVVATELKNPDFAAYAKAFGGFGVMVEKTADFPVAFRAAEKSSKPALIHLKVDTNASTPAMSLDAIRGKSLANSMP
jgi:acetolactate synthase I/II/III large subunit